MRKKGADNNNVINYVKRCKTAEFTVKMCLYTSGRSDCILSRLYKGLQRNHVIERRNADNE